MSIKRGVAVLGIAAAAVLLPSAAFAAAPEGGYGAGGAPAAHSLSGQEWGAAVSSAAPGGFIGCHASGGKAATC